MLLFVYALSATSRKIIVISTLSRNRKHCIARKTPLLKRRPNISSSLLSSLFVLYVFWICCLAIRSLPIWLSVFNLLKSVLATKDRAEHQVVGCRCDCCYLNVKVLRANQLKLATIELLYIHICTIPPTHSAIDLKNLHLLFCLILECVLKWIMNIKFSL